MVESQKAKIYSSQQMLSDSQREYRTTATILTALICTGALIFTATPSSALLSRALLSLAGY